MKKWLIRTGLLASILLLVILGVIACRLVMPAKVDLTNLTRPVNTTVEVQWTGETRTFEEPLRIPQEVLESDEFRRWLRKGNSKTVEHKREDGNVLSIPLAGIGTFSEGYRYPLLGEVVLRDAEGNVLAKTLYMPSVGPGSHTVYEDGQEKYAIDFQQDRSNKPLGLRMVRFYQGGFDLLIWQIDEDNVATHEFESRLARTEQTDRTDP